MKNSKLSLIAILLPTLFFMGASSIVHAGGGAGNSGSGNSRPMMGTEAFSEGTIRYYDNLKKCSPYTFSFESLFGKSQNKIVGRKNDRCLVLHIIETYTTTCNYSNETIALLTSAEKYEEARGNTFSASSNSALAQRVAAECVSPQL